MSQPTDTPTAAKIIADITKYLIAANTGLPVIVSLVDSVMLLFKGAGAEGPTVKERAEIIRANIGEARAFRDAELARLDALIAAENE